MAAGATGSHLRGKRSVAPSLAQAAGNARDSSVTIRTDFVSGGGSAVLTETDPVTVTFSPHKERDERWSQLWWHFLLEGLEPGEAGRDVVLELDMDSPGIAGISPQAFFSYDQQVWGLTDTGERHERDGQRFFVYRHNVKADKVWFAYDLPYTPEHIESILVPEVEHAPNVEVFELCKTQSNRPVTGLRFNSLADQRKKCGIWLQARTHAFESGSSWVLHELACWLASHEPAAAVLREHAVITVIPIVDVDGVVEGRTGKNQKPHDHNRGWHKEPAYWPEQRAMKSMLAEMAEAGEVDFFMDFHGPGNRTHPYFICALADNLPTEKQRLNRRSYFETAGIRRQTRLGQSMTQIEYSARDLDVSEMSKSSDWVAMNTTGHCISLTLEVNMNTPLSTRDGYRAQANELGRGISEYFVNGHHVR